MADINAEVEFTDEHPLLVDVAIINGKWDIQPSAEFLSDGKSYIDKMKERLKALDVSSLKMRVQPRIVKGGVPPESLTNPKHIPIAVREGEYVLFQCECPFTVWAHRELHMAPNLDSPDSPFGWKLPQPGKQDTDPQQSAKPAPYVVKGVTVAGLVPQRFYKTVAWITVGKETILVDPDMIGL